MPGSSTCLPSERKAHLVICTCTIAPEEAEKNGETWEQTDYSSTQLQLTAQERPLSDAYNNSCRGQRKPCQVGIWTLKWQEAWAGMRWIILGRPAQLLRLDRPRSGSTPLGLVCITIRYIFMWPEPMPLIQASHPEFVSFLRTALLAAWWGD